VQPDDRAASPGLPSRYTGRVRRTRRRPLLEPWRRRALAKGGDVVLPDSADSSSVIPGLGPEIQQGPDGWETKLRLLPEHHSPAHNIDWGERRSKSLFARGRCARIAHENRCHRAPGALGRHSMREPTYRAMMVGR